MNKDKMLDELSVLQERFANGMGWRDGEYAEALDEAIELINKMPSADVVEVKYGKWLSSYRTWEFTFECSVCGKENYEESNFCPNCGADMRERKESKVKKCFDIPKEVAERLLEDESTDE